MTVSLKLCMDCAVEAVLADKGKEVSSSKLEAKAHHG